MRIENESTRMGASVAGGIAATFATEMLRAGGAYDREPLMQLYEQDINLSRLVVAAIVAIAMYVLLEIKNSESKEE